MVRENVVQSYMVFILLGVLNLLYYVVGERLGTFDNYSLNERFTKIQTPIEARKRELMKKKETFQFKKDIEDENLRTEEKVALTSSQEVGNSLQAVNLILKKNKMMQAEIANHEPRVNAVFENGQKLISEGHPEKDKYERDLNDLTEKWARLQDLLEARRQKLLVNERVQQFLFDANEAESWMSEQELYMMVEDRGKDEFSAQNLMKKNMRFWKHLWKIMRRQ